MIVRDAGVFSPKDKGSNCPNYIESTWKPGFSKIYTVLNNCCLTSRGYTVLVGVGNSVRLVFTVELFLKGSGRNSIGIRVGFRAAIQAACSPGSQSSLYTIFRI